MMSGVRASSMKMLSASSTRAKKCPRWTRGSAGVNPGFDVHGPQNGVEATWPPLRFSRSRRKSNPNSDAVP